MATRNWLDVDGNWNNTANWSGGAVPVGSDTVTILRGSQNITTNVDQSAVNSLTIYIGEDFVGSIGTAAAPLKTGTGTTLHYNCSRGNPNFFFFPAATSTAIYIENTGPGPNAFQLVGGTTTSVYVRKAGYLNIGASATVTTLYVLYASNPIEDVKAINIENGATVGTIQQIGGYITSNAAHTTVNLKGGASFKHTGTVAAAITTLNMEPNCKFVFENPTTITTANIYGGTLDGSTNSQTKTITTANVWGGGQLRFDNKLGLNVVTTLNLYGGTYSGPAPGTNNVYIPTA